MAKTQVSIGLLVASLVLLVLYGIDVAVASSNPEASFLQIENASVRGSIFGGGALIMSLVAFVIARKEPSKPIVALLFVNGALIIIGVLAYASDSVMSVVTTVPTGAILIGLGGWKAATDRRVAGRKEQATR